MQFQQDYPQPAQQFYPQQHPQQHPQQYPMVGRMQASVQDVSAIWGNIAQKEKYGQRMVCLSCASGVISFLVISSVCALFQIQDGHVPPLLVVFAVLVCGPALLALAVSKESNPQGKKSLLKCFCCCSSLTVIVHIFMVLLYAYFLIGIWGLREMDRLNPDCNVERCRPSEKVKDQLHALEVGFPDELKPFGPIYSNVMMDCLAPVLWPKYVQASESQWSAAMMQRLLDTGAKSEVDFDGLASNIFSEQKQYPDIHKCPLGAFAAVCDGLDSLPPLERDEAPTPQQAFDACFVNNSYIDMYPYLVSGWWVPGLAWAGLFLHSAMFLLMCCGCRAGRKFGIHDEVEIELSMLRR